jgi:putative ABC transport system permease protein
VKNVIQSFLIALGMLRLHKMRAFLTMLGVIIGVMSVTMIVMISSGFQAYINGEFKKLGSDTMFVFFDPGRRGRGQNLGNVDKLTTDDITFVMQRVQSLDIAAGVMNLPSQKVMYGSKDVDNPQIYASDENFQELNRFTIIEGRSLNAHDITSQANVAVIGEEIRDRLFPDKKAIGKLILLQGIAFEVIGIVEKADFMGDNTGRMLLVPITTAQKKWVGGHKIDIMMLRAKQGTKVDDAMQAVWEAMMIRSGNKPIYRLDSRESILKVFGGVVGAAGAILAAVAALSLLVGGIGIMNIMLVSVTERTKEIGLRKAVGARRGSILTQFLVEAGTLSLVGGLIGMSIAFGLGQIVSMATASMHWPNKAGLEMPFPLMAAVFSAVFSAMIGMVFGLYPAMSAARLDPIVALRRE